MALEVQTYCHGYVMGCLRARTEDGKDPRRKLMLYLAFKKPVRYEHENNQRRTFTGEWYKECYSYSRIVLCRGWHQLQVGALYKQPDMFWRLAHVCETEKVNPRKLGLRMVWTYKPHFEWTTEAPLTPDYELAKLWVRMNFDWLLFNKIYKPQVRRHGLLV